MSELASPLLAGLGNTHFVLGLQLGELKNADAVRRARGDAGCSISWVVGHLLNSRCGILQSLGVDHPNPYKDKFSFQTPATDGGDYTDIAEFLADWNQVHAMLCEALSGLDDKTLLGESDLQGPHGQKTLLGALTFFMWHEAYHLGVIGLLRVQWGLRHTHVLAMEAMK